MTTSDGRRLLLANPPTSRINTTCKQSCHLSVGSLCSRNREDFFCLYLYLVVAGRYSWVSCFLYYQAPDCKKKYS
jgi:hypothetical protein